MWTAESISKVKEHSAEVPRAKRKDGETWEKVREGTVGGNKVGRRYQG